MVLDTDLVSYRATAPSFTGIRIDKLILAVDATGASSAGVITITSPTDGILLYPPLPVQVGQAAYTILFSDEPTDTKGTLTWRDFSITGLTATGTRLFLWSNW